MDLVGDKRVDLVGVDVFDIQVDVGVGLVVTVIWFVLLGWLHQLHHHVVVVISC